MSKEISTLTFKFTFKDFPRLNAADILTLCDASNMIKGAFRGIGAAYADNISVLASHAFIHPNIENRQDHDDPAHPRIVLASASFALASVDRKTVESYPHLKRLVNLSLDLPDDPKDYEFVIPNLTSTIWEARTHAIKDSLEAARILVALLALIIAYSIWVGIHDFVVRAIFDLHRHINPVLTDM